MGNTQSTGVGNHSTPSLTHLHDDDLDTRLASARDSRFSPTRSMFSSNRYSGVSDTWRRYTQQRMSSDMLANERERNPDAGPSRSHELEHHPLVPDHRDAQRNTLRSTPISARQTTISRLRSRLNSDNVSQTLLARGRDEDSDNNDNATSSSSRRSRHITSLRRMPTSSSDRFSISNPLRRRMEPRPEPTSRRSVRTLFNSNTNHQQLENDAHLPDDPEVHTDGTLTELRRDSSHRNRSRTRFSRVRHSIASPITSLLRPGAEPSSNLRRLNSTSGPSARNMTADESSELLSQSQQYGSRFEHENNSQDFDVPEPETSRNVLSSARLASGMSSIRRFQGLRSRSTRLIRRGEHPPLSQVLQLAAAAIAAQLSGSSEAGTDGPRAATSPAFDGSIQNFVQTLQDAASAQAGENVDLNAADGDLPPVNFMRVFQFPNDENGTPLASTPPNRSDHDQDANHDPDRSVTLVLVGVRSMPNILDGSSAENGTLGPSLDTLLSLPFMPPANVLRNGSSGALFRRSDTRFRQHARRHSSTNAPPSSAIESLRAARPSTQGNLVDHAVSNNATPFSDSPPGPNPPPSTPADIRSGHATPIRRPSSASAVHGVPLPDLDEDRVQNITNPDLSETNFNVARQRRRSDSEFARRPELSSGNSRRNGVVEPDQPPTGAGRSWLIYVVGTNVSPDHPAFTMPSLFTDNPSYEDMQMLSTLLGPVKPPVASQEDVESAGGLYRISTRGGTMIAVPVTDPAETMTLALTERCLICLCEYDDDDEVRQLSTCHHLYHRECIDEWLTTGRNSCPMCRGQGVQEKTSTPGTAPPSTESGPASIHRTHIS